MLLEELAMRTQAGRGSSGLLGRPRTPGTLIPLLAHLIKLDSEGPVFCARERVGRGGRLLRVYTFRSKVEGTDDGVDVPREAGFKTSDQVRVTRVGRLLRRTSLDETSGSLMSCEGRGPLGPRPEEPAIVERYSDRHRRRLVLNLGMTGPMQIHGKADLPLNERVQPELTHMEHYSLREDIRVLVHTLSALIAG